MTILFKQARKGGASCTDYEVLSIMLLARGIEVHVEDRNGGRRIWVNGAYVDFDRNGNLEDIDSRHA